MVLARSPGPPMTGRKAVIRTALAALAAEGHEVEVLALARPGPVAPGCRVVWLGTPSRARMAWNAAMSVAGGSRSLNEALFHSGALLARVRRLRGRYDFAIADTIRAAPYASALGVPWHLDMDDLFSARYEGFLRAARDPLSPLSAGLLLGYFRDSAPGLARALPGTLVRRILGMEAARLHERERYWAARAGSVSLVSPDEAERFGRTAARPVHHLPMSVAVPPAGWSRPPAASGPVFVGPLDYKPNLDALLHFQQAVHPALAAAGEPLILRHVGHAPEALRRRLRGAVHFEGYVEDLPARLRAADFFLAPIVSGTGIKTKVLEALAAGLPVLSSAEGVSGLRVEHRRHCFICRTPADFAEGVRQLRDPAVAARMSGEGRRYVEENFSSAVLRTRWSAVLRTKMSP